MNIKNLSSQGIAHVFSANFAAVCVKNPCNTASIPADFCLVNDKIMLENPHTNLVKTGSKKIAFGIFSSRSDFVTNILASIAKYPYLSAKISPSCVANPRQATACLAVCALSDKILSQNLLDILQ